MDMKVIGKQIAALRKNKGITQSELGNRLGVSFQAVSKWERGETLPDISVLPTLAKILETSIDYILTGGEVNNNYKGKQNVSDLIKGIECLKNAGSFLGIDNPIYRAAIDGINTTLNANIEEAFENDYIFEAFLAEVVILNLKNGFYIDITDVNNNFRNEHFKTLVVQYCKDYGIV